MIEEKNKANRQEECEASSRILTSTCQNLDLSAVRTDLECWKHRITHEFGLRKIHAEVVIEGGTADLESRYRFEFCASGWKHELVFHELRINAEWGTPAYCFTIGDLAHILFHVHDNVVGNPVGCDDHNPTFINHAAEYGLIIDDDGVTRYAANSAFTRLLEANRVSTASLFDLESYIAREAANSFDRVRA